MTHFEDKKKTKNKKKKKKEMNQESLLILFCFCCTFQHFFQSASWILSTLVFHCLVCFWVLTKQGYFVRGVRLSTYPIKKLFVWTYLLLNGGNLFTTPFIWIFGNIWFFKNCWRKFYFCKCKVFIIQFLHQHLFCRREIICFRDWH